MKRYSFKLYDSKFIGAMEKWVDNGYTIAGVITELLAKYEGLEVPKPNELQDLRIEVNRQRIKLEQVERDSRDMAQVLLDITTDMETLSAQYRQLLNLTNFQVEAE